MLSLALLVQSLVILAKDGSPSVVVEWSCERSTPRNFSFQERQLSASVTTVDAEVGASNVVGGVTAKEDDRTHEIDLLHECQ